MNLRYKIEARLKRKDIYRQKARKISDVFRAAQLFSETFAIIHRKRIKTDWSISPEEVRGIFARELFSKFEASADRFRFRHSRRGSDSL